MTIDKEKVKARKKAYYENNKEEIKAYNKAYYENNREKVKAYNKAYRENNKEEIKTRRKAYRENNKEEVKAYYKAYKENNREKTNANFRKRLATDPMFKLRRLLGTACRRACKGFGKPANTLKLIGCTYEQVKAHLEKQFTEGMSWDNMGEWHIDHVKPMSAFITINENGKRDNKQIKYSCHWTNLQPLWGVENISKGGTWTEEDEAKYTPPDLNKSYKDYGFTGEA